MNIVHWMRKEDSGLVRQTIEIAKYEERAGHQVSVVTPFDYEVLYGKPDLKAEVHSVHSGMPIKHYHEGTPKLMWMHGEPLGSVANGVSMKTIANLASTMDAFICMRREEQPVWNSLRRTYYVPKGVDLERYRPITLPADQPKLHGNPSILYYENWRGQRNPLYLCVAMERVQKVFPEAKLHLYNVQDQKMLDTFKAMDAAAKWSETFIRSLKGKVTDPNLLLNRADIVVSCLYPLYARGIEAFAAGKAFIGPGYREPDYPFTCELDPISMGDAIIKCWENYDSINYRRWAEDRHDVAETVRQWLDITKRYL
jgi:glycosyltransferase involved in cell wall biosynthesis